MVWGAEQFNGSLHRQLVGDGSFGHRGSLGVFSYASAHIGAEATFSHIDRLAVFVCSQQDFVYLSGIYLVQMLRYQSFETDCLFAAAVAIAAVAEIELSQPRNALLFAAGYAVQIVFHAGCESIIHKVGEVGG